MSDPMRRFLLAIFLFGAGGLTAELLLLNHVEDGFQLVPIAILTLGSALIVLVAIVRTAALVSLFRMVMLMSIASGGLGMYLHFKANIEFQLEVDPTLAGLALVRKALAAKAPPALAPGAMVQLGLLGLAYAFRHQASGTRE
jgi:hypothetical protein